MNAGQLLALYEKIADAPEAIPCLRRFILDLAVRGKLVPQDPADEPASELLKRVAADKARLVKSGEIKVRKIAARERDEPLEFQSPTGWVLTDLGTVAHKITDGAHKTPTYVENGVPFVSVKDFSGGQLDLSNTRFIPEAEHSVLYQRCDPRRGDILLGRIGTLGKAVLVDTDVEFSLFVSVGLIRFDHGNINPNFFRLLLNSPFVKQEFDRIKIGGGTHTNKLNLGDLHTVALPLPPLAEQHCIVARVHELMALCDRLEAAREKREATRDRLSAASLARLKQPDPDLATFANHARFALDNLATLTARADQVRLFRQTILNLAVRGKLAEQDPSERPVIDCLLALDDMPKKTRELLKPLDPSECGGVIPESWAWLPLGSMIKGMDAGWSPQCENHPRADETQWGVLKTTAVQALAFNASEHKKLPEKLLPRAQHEAQVGDILVTRAGPKNRVGVSCVVDVPCPRLMISDKLIRFHVLGELSPRYFALTLNAGYTFERLEAAKSGMAVMQMNISQNKLRAVPIPVPPLAEQHRIVTKVDELMALCDRLEASLEQSATTRRRLLDALLHEVLQPEARELEAAE